MKTVECERKSVDVQFCPDLGPESSRLRFLHDFVNYFDVVCSARCRCSPPGFITAGKKINERTLPLYPIKAAASGWTVKHNHKVNVYLLPATLNSPNEPAGGPTATSSASVPPPTQGEAQTQCGPLCVHLYTFSYCLYTTIYVQYFSLHPRNLIY